VICKTQVYDLRLFRFLVSNLRRKGTTEVCFFPNKNDELPGKNTYLFRFSMEKRTKFPEGTLVLMQIHSFCTSKTAIPGKKILICPGNTIFNL